MRVIDRSRPITDPIVLQVVCNKCKLIFADRTESILEDGIDEFHVHDDVHFFKTFITMFKDENHKRKNTFAFELCENCFREFIDSLAINPEIYGDQQTKNEKLVDFFWGDDIYRNFDDDLEMPNEVTWEDLEQRRKENEEEFDKTRGDNDGETMPF